MCHQNPEGLRRIDHLIVLKTPKLDHQPALSGATGMVEFWVRAPRLYTTNQAEPAEWVNASADKRGESKSIAGFRGYRRITSVCRHLLRADRSQSESESPERC